MDFSADPKTNGQKKENKIYMTVTIKLAGGTSGFAEDKDAARGLRVSKILPALNRGERIVLDFGGVNFATQSFVHALIGEALKRYGEDSLAKFEFKNCSPQLQSLVELVVSYSLGGFPLSEPVPEPANRS